MKRKLAVILVLLVLAVSVYSACSGTENSSESSESATKMAASSKEETASSGTTSDTTINPKDPVLYEAKDYPTVEKERVTDKEKAVFSGTASTAALTITAENGSKIEVEGSTYTLKSEDTYTVSGKLSDGRIIVDAGDVKVRLVLDNVSITSKSSAAILCKSADKLNLTAKENTFNVIADAMESEVPSNAEENYDAAIWADCDLDLEGTGTLVVTSKKNNGVKTKDDLEIKELSLSVTAYNNALKGNDSVTVKSGTLLLTSETSDGIKTSNSGTSSKGKQKGTIELKGGSIEIRSAKDAVQAAYDVAISEGAFVAVYTATYAGQENGQASDKAYLIVPSSLYSTGYDYYACFYNDDETAEFVRATYETMVTDGKRKSYYGLSYKPLSGYENVRFLITETGKTPSATDYTAVTDGQAVNRSMNGFCISSITENTIEGDWVMLGTSSNSGNTQKTSYSAKGIKAENEIRISGGTVVVYAMDDAVHANGGEKLENEAKGLGNVTISGGSVFIVSADDGIHADSDLTIKSGTVYVRESHEGIEANRVLIEGGDVFVIGSDDGLNACAGNYSPLIQVSGGYLDVTTSSGDTDAIDSNGSFVQTGGFILVKGGSNIGGMAGSVDVDGSIEVSGGFIIAFGGICETPSNNVNVFANRNTSFSAGSYELTGTSGNLKATFKLTSSYSSVWIAGNDLETGETYTISRDGTRVLSWTQESGTTGDGGSGGFSPGGGFNPGGFGGGMGPGRK